jgi:hypothetical protein
VDGVALHGLDSCCRPRFHSPGRVARVGVALDPLCSLSAKLLTRMLTTSLDDHGRLWTERHSSPAVSRVRGPLWTAVDGCGRL